MSSILFLIQRIVHLKKKKNQQKEKYAQLKQLKSKCASLWRKAGKAA